MRTAYSWIFLCSFLLYVFLSNTCTDAGQKNYRLVFDKYNYWQKNKIEKEAFYIICESGYFVSPRLYELSTSYDYYSKCKDYKPLNYLSKFKVTVNSEERTYPAYPVILGQKLFFLCDGFFSNTSECPVSKKDIAQSANRLIEALDFSKLEQSNSYF